tara:strand:- start:2995 stop:3267 length:273 start_codon:yes stop_codon:yes gene_type:complete
MVEAVLMGISLAMDAYGSKRQHDKEKIQRVKAERASAKAKRETQGAENVKAQGLEKTEASTFQTDNPYEATGGIPMSIKKRLRIGSGANI